VLLVIQEGVVVPRPNTESNTEVAKLQVFDGTARKFLRFLMLCKLFIRIKMKEDAMEDQIHWILLYIQ